MARGSSGGSSPGAPSGAVVEMLGESGELSNQGKTRVRKKYLVQNEADLVKVPTIQGFRATQVGYNKISGGVYEQNVDYAAQLTNGQAPGIVEKLGGLDGTFEMVCSYEVKNIELHPKIVELREKYGGYIDSNGDTKWPPFYTPIDGSGLSSGKPKRNPLNGVTRYKDTSMTFRHTYYVTNVPRSIYEKAGKQVLNLPAGFPTPPGPKDDEGKELKRRWLMQIPAISREGNSYRVVQDYVLLDPITGDDIYETTSAPGQV